MLGSPAKHYYVRRGPQVCHALTSNFVFTDLGLVISYYTKHQHEKEELIASATSNFLLEKSTKQKKIFSAKQKPLGAKDIQDITAKGYDNSNDQGRCHG